MESPGKLLREAREERGLTLEDVAAMTRIPKTMLDHLESDRFEEYVAEVFARGHLRNYANELCIDADEVLKAYEQHTGSRKRQTSTGGWSTPVGLESKAKSGRRAKKKSKSTSEASGAAMGLGRRLSALRRSHFIAVALVLAGLFMMFGYLTNNRATAQDPAEYEQFEETNWELHQDVEETRWQLEQGSEGE